MNLGNPLPFSASLGQLSANNIITQGFRFAANTVKNNISNIRTFFFFCTYFKLVALPAEPKTLCYFAELLALTVSFGHIKNVLSSVKYLHAAYNHEYPVNNFGLDATLQGLKRKLAKTPFQVLPITPDILRNMFDFLDMKKKSDLALWVSYLVAFFCLFRKKNVCPESSEPSKEKTLRRKHIEIDHANNIVYIYCNFSKTNQFGSSDLVIPIPGNEDPKLDLVRHLTDLLATVDADPDQPAFTYGPGKFVHYSLFTEKLKSLLSSCGLDASLYSGHSFRRGGASFLYQVGGSILQIMSSGSWSSTCFTRYLFLTEEERMEAQLLISSAINRGQ